MKFIKYPEADTVIGKAQPEYNPLHGRLEAHNRGRVVMCLQLDNEEIETLRDRDGCLWVELLTFNNPMQPISISLDKPEFEPPQQPKSDPHHGKSKK